MTTKEIIDEMEEITISIRIDKLLLKRIDKMAEKHERDRSKLMRFAIKEYLDIHEEEYIKK